MFVDVTPVSAMWALYAIAALVLAVVMLRARITKGNIAIGLILVQQFFQTIAFYVFSMSREDALASAAFHGGVYFWLLWAPFVFAAAPLLLWETRRRPVALAVGGVGAAPSVLLVLLGSFRTDLVFRADGSGVTEAVSVLLLWSFAAFAFLVLMLAWEAFTTPLPMHRAQYALLAAAFAGEGMYHASVNVAKIVFRLDFFGEAAPTSAQAVVAFVPFVVLLGVAAFAAARSFGAPASGRGWAQLVLAFLLVAAVTGFVSSPVASDDEYHSAYGAFHALWDLASLFLVVFAALRFQLFGVELRAKQGLVASVGLLAAAAVYIIAENMAQNFIQDEYLGFLPGANGVAALITAAAGLPILAVAQRLGRRFFPNVVRSDDYDRQRREDLYRVAVEGAFLDGNVTTREVQSLRKLRAHLGLSDDDHERIEGSVRSTLDASAPRPSAS